MKNGNKEARHIPSHLALIPDGNRRWSSLHRLSILKGYQVGVEKFTDFGIWAKELGVNTLTVWALSTENVRNRSGAELNILYKLLSAWATDPKILNKLKSNRARIRIIGNLKLLPENVKNALKELERKTKIYEEFTINVLIGYGGKDDLLYAFRKIYGYALQRKISHISDSIINENIRTSSIPDVDLIIRTSGEQRLSGFLPWQSDYSELYFSKKYWPDFDKRDLQKALRTFSERQRRFGK